MIKQTSLLRLEWNAEKRWHTKFHTDRRSGRLEIYSKLILCRVVLMQKIGPASAIGLGSNRVLNGLWDIVSNNWWAAHEQELTWTMELDHASRAIGYKPLFSLDISSSSWHRGCAGSSPAPSTVLGQPAVISSGYGMVRENQWTGVRFYNKLMGGRKVGWDSKDGGCVDHCAELRRWYTSPPCGGWFSSWR